MVAAAVTTSEVNFLTGHALFSVIYAIYRFVLSNSIVGCRHSGA